MPLFLRDYIDCKIHVEDNTDGGDTYYLDGKPKCFTYVSAHHRAVEVISGGKVSDVSKLTDDIVDEALEKGLCTIDDSAELEAYPWLAIKVWDEEGVYIGEIGSRCMNLAGRGTEHKGTGRCQYHCSEDPVHVMKTGRHALRMQAKLRKKIEDYSDMMDSRSLEGELAIQRVLLNEMVDHLYDEEMVSPAEMVAVASKIVYLADVVGRQVERITTIEQKSALTASQVMYLQVTVADILTKYIVDPRDREQAARELSRRLGTNRVDPDKVMNYDPNEYAVAVFE